MTSLRFFDVPEVLEVQVVPSDEVRMVPESPTETYDVVLTIKVVTDSVLLAFPAESLTTIVQLE